MFLDIYQFQTICLLLLLKTFTHCEGSTHGTFFQSVPEQINQTTFPVDLKLPAKSDVILLKCPGSLYKHGNIEDKFYKNILLGKSSVMPSNEEILFNWILSVYNASGPQQIHCGTVGIKRNDGSQMPYEWKFNFNWQPTPNPFLMAKKVPISNQLPSPSKCGTDQEKILKYTKDKNGKLFKLNLVNDLLTTPNDLPHANKLYYLFTIPQDSHEKEFAEPCTIFRAVNNRPLMVIKGYNSTQIPLDNTKIDVITFDYLESVLTIQLVIENQPLLQDFYKNEEILINKVVYTKDGIKEVPHSNKITKGTFSINGYELLNFTYNCPTLEGNEMITKIFYFAPPNDKYIYPLEYFLYASNETVVKPNCSINGFNFGYLHAVGYIEKIVSLDELNANGVAKYGLYRSGSFVFTSDTTQFNTTLNCHYKTPNGEIIFINSFLHNDKARFETDKNGNKYLKVDSDGINVKGSEKSGFAKLKEKVGLIGAISIIVGSVFGGILILTGFCALIFLKQIKLHIRRKKLASKHPNIFKLWKELSNANLEKYCEIVQHKKYIPDILKKQTFIKKIEGDEEVDFDTTALFNSSLVKCFKSIFGEIRAHYINDVSPERKYIISDGPTPERVKYFWELLYKEDVAVVISIIHQEKSDGPVTDEKQLYWSKKNQNYGNVAVKFLDEVPTNLSYVKVLKFSMTMKGKEPKKVTLFHVSYWKEHAIPSTDLHFTNLYSEVSECAGNRNVLVHASRSAGSRVFMFTYFCCILEAMETDTSVYNPMEIIKEVREKRYGGNISSMEYAYLLKALVTYFFDNNMLIGGNNGRINFAKEYEHYLYNLEKRENKMKEKFKNFLKYVNVIDSGKLNDLCVQFDSVGMMSNGDLLKKCQRFNMIKSKLLKKNRYNDIVCLDKYSININGYDSKDIRGYIHANQMVYKYGDEKERKIIMCQAPIQTTVDDMYDMIFRYKIGIIVVLVNVNEIKVQNKCYPYFPADVKDMKTSRYTVLYIDKKVDEVNHIIEYDYTIYNNKNVASNFKLLHYINWPDKSIPNESKPIHELYKKIINLYNDRYIAIHCSAGIGRTGTLALVIYMIDMINYGKAFDPVKFLETLRMHRYKAVQTKSQFIFSLSILYEHFKDEIKKMDKEAYDNFTKLAEDIYRQDGNYRK
ncbi:Protein-tyrosine phosphatase, receptor/non-receptor type domain and Protein-tyrosine/Dual specificity phosphatase domain and Protein-tyrosine phosphatase, catalytic domain-containing protein [Strongyloides ratti]|uniref:Protein-tyrosine phosphatase, receptor/non-receptor type domain and Protein-tyrosine/Dual specificity phosphatase domain and Protein-tyrosine phosphatase, catalytic domain-containing protein n=1 Tax=Strongyloides ratti TaxID=34506 RepID=A0A090MWP1_STRRB|nr:Protein-tyrosine phosphatase, receptor/non-receptor type domain and Protein-tyrosine/Dual specificity phosphatase domain and Protein-tyrosine phosphatase, catalytic domain-containing protein [Strongyloides ratti]CEF64024.1 Protein-tyrosine phosphatase, receptor/non-receptor type domain and Protein-tyrosine/Dual specificity phosphatase domain and Protein-tyrosine phosphatase, catalytic domain-containing protein [Strongyloides ratti]